MMSRCSNYRLYCREMILSLCVLVVVHVAVSEARTKLHFKKHGIRLQDSEIPDQCHGVYCGHGMECQLSASNQPECVCMSFCKQHHKPVCGSDGRRYDNHCELHRAACLERRRIAIAHTKECFYKNDDCDEDSYAIMKDQVLHHHLEDFSQSQTDTGNAMPSVNKKFAVSMMFGYYDADLDQTLDADELDKVTSKERLQEITGVCSVLDLLRYDDANLDTRIDIDEFYAAFGISVVSLPEESVFVTTDSFLGEKLSLTCGITTESDVAITWKRNGVDLGETTISGIRVNPDGTLYFNSLTTLHTGKYACHSDRSEAVTQTHLLQVKVPPVVEVCPQSQVSAPDSTVSIQCHTFGIPSPQISWNKNGIAVTTDTSENVIFGANNTGIEISNVGYSESGSYTCLASNDVGEQQATSTLFVEDQHRTRHHGPFDLYFVFHKSGIKVFDPKTCQLSRSILASDAIVSTDTVLCPTRNCSWSGAVQVDSKYIYAAQPRDKRIVIVDVITEQVIKVVNVGGLPVDVKYIKHLDEVWVLLWDTDDGENAVRTTEVIARASQANELDTLQTQPNENHFQALFTPPDDMMLQGEFKYVYYVRKNEMTLVKLDVSAMAQVHEIDLSGYHCYPTAVGFVANGGSILIQCIDGDGKDRQLIMDYLTDTVIAEVEAVMGKPYVSPDGKYIVSVDNNSGNLFVQSVSTSGEIKTAFDVHTNLHVSDIVFYPSQSGHSYDIFASSKDKADVLFVNLHDSKVRMVTSVGQATASDQWPWNDNNRVICSSGRFGQYLLTPADSSVVIIDAATQELRCEIGDIFQGNVVVWIGSC